MRGFVLGLCVGALVGAGGVWLLLRDKAAPRGTVTVAPGADGGVAATGKKKRRGGARGGGGGGGGGMGAGEAGDEPAPVLGPADLRMTSEGDSLSRGAQSLDFAGSPGEEPRELTQGEIDGAMGGVSDAIGECIVNATGNAELSGRINAGVVVGPDGRVTQTRVEGPAYLMKRGLASCVRARLRGLRFPRTGRESVVKYPFTVS